jgi:hypothetical protein
MPIMTDPTSPHSNTRNAYFEPCVLYSASADHYALWFLSTNTKAVAVSDSPIGPFESVSWDTGLAQVRRGRRGPGRGGGWRMARHLAPSRMRLQASPTPPARRAPTLTSGWTRRMATRT